MNRRDLLLSTAALASFAVVGTGCSSTAGKQASGGELKMWTHNGGNKEELAVVQKIVDDFNASSETKVKVESFPQASYNDAIVAAAASGDLPDILDMDGPIMPNWAWAGYLSEIKVDQKILDDMLPTTIGKYKGKVYSVGPYDTALAILARKSVLKQVGARIPTVEKPWTKDEFAKVLDDITATKKFPFAIDLGVWDAAEWWPYAYSPLLQSFGADLIDRKTYKSAAGVLNGPKGIEFGRWFQSFFDKKWASKTPGQGGKDFVTGKVPMVWAGGWKVLEAQKQFGEDEVVILPPPDLGAGPKVGAGSWQWGISKQTKNLDAAQKFINHLLQDKYLIQYSDALGNFPSKKSAVQGTKYYKTGGVLEPIYKNSEAFALVRPETPGYAVISSVFDKAMHDIMAGTDPKKAFDQAVKDIDSNIKANDGYGF